MAKLLAAKPMKGASAMAEPAFKSGMTDPIHPRAGDSVGVVMTPADQRALLASTYPSYDALSVKNLPPRTRGKHY